MNHEQWYFEHFGQRVGPFLWDELNHLANARMISPGTRLVDTAGNAALAREKLDFGSAIEGTDISSQEVVTPPSPVQPEEEFVVTEIAPDQSKYAASSDGLSLQEFAIYGAVFLCIPIVCVLLSSVLYYAWKSSRPKAASQVNLLGFGVFFFQTVVGCLIGSIGAG